MVEGGEQVGAPGLWCLQAGIPGVIASVDIADFVVAPDSITSLTACLQLCDDTVGCEVTLSCRAFSVSSLGETSHAHEHVLFHVHHILCW